MGNDPVCYEPVSVRHLNIVDVGGSMCGDAHDLLTPLTVHPSKILRLGSQPHQNHFLLGRNEPDVSCELGHVLSSSYEESAADYSRMDSKTQQKKLDVAKQLDVLGLQRNCS